MIGLRLSIPQVAVRQRTGGSVPPAEPFFGSSTQSWGDTTTPVFGKV